jgi:hypothetical protein
MIAPKSSQRIPDAAYRFLLLLYPPGFRLRFGPDMLQVFRDTYSDQARCGGFEHRLRFWVSVLADTACSLPCEWGQTLLKSEEISLTLEILADTVAMPVWIMLILVAQGYTVAALAQGLQYLLAPAGMPPRAPLGNTEVLAITAIISCGLGLLSALIAWGMARMNRIQQSILKL